MLITRLIILVSMLAMHVIGDWVLQTPLMCDLKQKAWWQQNYGFQKNARDYKMVILMHSMLWSACVMMPVLVYQLWIGCSDLKAIVLLLVFVINMLVHAWIDDLKANKDKLSLVDDHAVHLLQVAIIFFFFA